MIPSSISRENVLAAISRIDREGIPSSRKAAKFEVRHEGRTYPPKLLVSLACEDAIGRPLDSILFSGGLETNGFLQSLGFTVAYKRGATLPAVRQTFRVMKKQTHTHTSQVGYSQGHLENLARQLLETQRLYTWAEIEENEKVPPHASGVYAWFFKSIPSVVPIDGCFSREGRMLLYVGIAPKSPRSEATLKSRMRQHFSGHAEGSTLRLTLGCLLEDELDTVLRRVGSGKRKTFGPFEERLTKWIAKNAAVTWVEVNEPWVLEPYLIQNQNLPLNIEGNSRHPFYDQLRKLRKFARQRARDLAILREY